MIASKSNYQDGSSRLSAAEVDLSHQSSAWQPKRDSKRESREGCKPRSIYMISDSYQSSTFVDL